MGQLLDALRGIAMPEQKRTQMVYLDEAFEACKAEREALKLENRDLRAQVEPLKKTAERLEQRLKEHTAKKDKNVVHEEADEVEQTLLSYLASMKQSENRTTKKVSDAIRQIHPESEMTELKARVYLKRLVGRELVAHTPAGYAYSNVKEHWTLTDRGEEYVVLHQLEHTAGSSHAPTADVDATEIEIMKFIGEKKSVPSADIQKGMGLHSVAAEHFLARLLKAKLVEQHPGYGVVAVHYSLSDKGNEYLIENKLVPLSPKKA